MPRGTVSSFDSENSCGFIRQEDGSAVFFYESEIETPGVTLKEGDEVVYSVAWEYQGPIAAYINLADSSTGSATDETHNTSHHGKDTE